MKKLYVGNLPAETSEHAVSELFSEYGKVRSIHLMTDVFTRKCRGFGFIEMEGHEARAAVAGLDGKTFGGKPLRVRFEDAERSQGRRRR
ncbi:MAG: RNA-binding protein [Gammaproteobacteria bacterium]|nr:RNA-binding protein [Gammaproteobacteria bacterium]